jgi:hypothetical protein
VTALYTFKVLLWMDYYLITWKYAIVLLSKVFSLFARTPQALSTGQYPLQSGLKKSDTTINT